MAKEMKGQMSLFEPDFIKDMDCTADTPVKRGVPDEVIYGSGKRIEPHLPGRKDSKHFESIYLDSLLPLEEYKSLEPEIRVAASVESFSSPRIKRLMPSRNLSFHSHHLPPGKQPS